MNSGKKPQTKPNSFSDCAKKGREKIVERFLEAESVGIGLYTPEIAMQRKRQKEKKKKKKKIRHSNFLQLISECILRPLLECCVHPSQGRAEGKGNKGVQWKGSELGKGRGHLEARKLKGYNDNKREK